MDMGFRADLIVEKKVIIELKSVETIAPVQAKQLLTYLRITNEKLGRSIDKFQRNTYQKRNHSNSK